MSLELERLKVLYDRALEEHTKAMNRDIGDMSYSQYISYLKPYSDMLESLQKKMDAIRVPQMTQIPKHCSVMSIEDFKSCCDDGSLIDYDGMGYYVKDGLMSDLKVYPSDSRKLRSDYDSIAWFNK